MKDQLTLGELIRKLREINPQRDDSWRLNEGDVKRHTLKRLDSFIDAIVGKRLTYKRLIAPVEVSA